MRTLNELAWKYIEPIFSAKKRAWVCSPWISKAYAERLLDLSKNGIEVRIITSDDPYNADTFSYLSQLLPKGSAPALTNFDVHFIKKELVHSKLYVVDNSYAIAGAVNFTYTGLNRQTNNFTIAEGQEVQAIVNDFMRLWIGFRSETVKPTKTALKNVLPIIPYKEAVLPEIQNGGVLELKSAKLTIRPYYLIRYSLMENVHLPWYQHQIVEDKGSVVIDPTNNKVLNNTPSNNNIINELTNVEAVKESAVNFSDEYEIDNHASDVKVDNYNAEQLARNFIKEKNRQEIPYNDRYQGLMHQSYLPSYRAITILSREIKLLPTWDFEYTFKGNVFSRTILASSGKIVASNLHVDGAVCEDCGKSVAKTASKHCHVCGKWVCPTETVVCSSCQKTYHKVHLSKKCSVCNQKLCNQCVLTCPVCKRVYGRDHIVNCQECGIQICSDCIATTGFIFKKKRCPACEAKAMALKKK